MQDNFYIPKRFEKAITLHIIKNQFDSSFRTPLLLGIHGKPGDGKTFQCEYILQQLGVKSFLISGGELESMDAGKPAQLIRDTYLEAGESVDNKEALMSAILINDIDTGLGSWGEMVQYTINRQTVFGELMHLVDYPNQVENIQTRRVPIIFTGNDFSKLYEPLVRAGRMTAFLWSPTTEEKSHMIQNIFPYLNIDECYNLLTTLENFAHEDLPIAFFSHLNDTLYDEFLWSSYQQYGMNNLVGLIRNHSKPTLDNSNVEQLINFGVKLIQSGQLINHLK